MEGALIGAPESDGVNTYTSTGIVKERSHLFRPVHNIKLIFVGFFFQIAVVPDSFTVSKGAVYIGNSIVHFLVNLRI